MKVTAATAWAQSFTALDWGSRALAKLRGRFCSARRRGAVTSSSERWAIVEAQAAAFSSLGVAETLEGCSGWSSKFAALLGVAETFLA